MSEEAIAKKKFTERLQLINGGRRFYLDFLRNQGSLIVLMTFTLLLWAKIDFTRLDWENTVPTLLFFLLLGSSFLAFYSNSTIFYELCFEEWQQWQSDTRKTISDQGLDFIGRCRAMIQALWRERFLEFMEILVVIFFFQVSIGLVVVSSLISASSSWRIIHPTATNSTQSK